MTQRYDWPFHNDPATVIRRYFAARKRGRGRIRVIRWNRLDHTGVGYWLRYLRYEPRDFAFTAPRRIACRLLRRHNITCAGRPDHRPNAVTVRNEQRLIRTGQRLSEEDVQALRDHAKQHGLSNLPFNATVRTVDFPAARAQTPRHTGPRFWPVYRSRQECRNRFTWALRYALAEPRDAAYGLPGRLACRLLGRHNVSCRGRLDHPE
ncbi:hypothetical protein [Streptomyces sp. NPDC088182]|uniref:hypothetical protein n=1 Tax=Streptomyces sp. NPDC088182 TaxID=3365838 RepID=UPI0038119B98